MKFEIEVESMPDGFRPVAYRPVEKGERFLGRDGEVIEAALGHFAPWLILEPIEAEPAEQAATKFLNGLGDEIKALSDAHGELVEVCARTDAFVNNLAKRLMAIESGKPSVIWGLWGRWSEEESERWHTIRHKSAEDARVSAGQYQSGFWKPYPYPADGGMPMELRETPVTVSPGGTNYVYDQPKLPTLWGVWLEQDNRWAGSNIGEGCIAFFRSKVASEKYAFACGGEARPLPIEELIKDA